MALVKRMNFQDSLLSVMFLMLPVLMSLGTFAVFVSRGNKLEADVVFRTVAFFNALRFPLLNLPGVLGRVISAMVSVNRLRKFLDMEDGGDEEGMASSGPAGDGATANAATSPTSGSRCIGAGGGE